MLDLANLMSYATIKNNILSHTNVLLLAYLAAWSSGLPLLRQRDLGSGVYDVGVQVPSRAPGKRLGFFA